MPSARKKCICQLCTCGRHMCPHRKKDHVVIGDGKSSGKSSKQISTEESRRQRKQWDLSKDGQSISVTDSQINADGCAITTTNRSVAVKVKDKGNKQQNVLTEHASRWSDKNIPKTLPIKRPDNLKAEGTADFRTIHQQDFNAKSLEAHESAHSMQASSTISTQNTSWNQKQISKTQKIKKPDTLTFSGPLNLETTHKSEYSENILKSKSYQENSEQTDSYQRPRTSLKLSGEFQSDSSYQTAYTAKKAENEIKIKKGTSVSNLKSEGEMSFRTTSLDYDAVNSRVSQTTEMTGSLNPKLARPSSEIKIPAVPLDDETTAVTDFKRWKVERPVNHKPADTLQLGDASETQFLSSKSTVRSSVETSASEYSNWDVSRPVIRKPENNLKPEGDFHFTTTHDIDYSPGRDKINMKQTNLESVIEHTENSTNDESYLTTQTAENQNVKHEQLIETLHDAAVKNVKSEEVQTTAIDNSIKYESKADHETSEVTHDYKDFHQTSDNMETNVIDTQEQSKVSSDSIQYDSNAYEDDNVQYVSWDEIRPKPIRPHSNLKQEGGMEFSTTNRSEFIPRSLERVKGIRPKTTTKIFEGDFDSTTMNQIMFSNETAEKVSPIRPKENLHVEGGNFSTETTSSREFQQWNVKRPSPFLPKPNLMQEGTIDFTTTNKTEYEGKISDKVHPIRPTTTNKIVGGEAEMITTNMAMHAEFPLEHVQKIVPQPTLRMNSGEFVSETTNKTQFQEWEIDRPKPIRPVSNLKQEGSMDFTTMNNMQFEEKPLEKLSQFRPQTTTKITGDFDGTTTNQIMYAAQTTDRPQMIKPKGNLELEKGEFATDTTNKSQFQQWQPSKPEAVTPRNNLYQEGKIDFTTTNSTQFGQKPIERVKEIKPKTETKITGDFEGITTNQVMFQNTHTEKSQPIRPKTNLMLEKGSFIDETTNNKEYQTWEYSKPSPIKPHSSLHQEGSIDFTTTNDTQFYGKTAVKVSEFRPKASTKIIGDGEFVGITTNQAMFQNNSIERVKGKRPSTNIHLESGKLDDLTTARREYQEWEIDRPHPIKPTGNLTQEGEMNFITSNQTDFQPKTVPKVESIRPKESKRASGEFDGTTTNQLMFQNKSVERVHDIRPKDNLHVEGGLFNSETTSSREFGYKVENQFSHAKPIRPVGNLSQEGEMNFTTSNQTDFQPKVAPKVEAIKPQPSSQVTGEFDGTTTNQIMFQTKTIERVHDIRPKDNLQLDGGEFDSETTTTREFGYNTDRRVSQYKPIKPIGNLTQEGEMDFVTSNQTDFQPKTIPKVEAIKPQQTSQVTGKFDGTTTNQIMYQTKTIERVHDIRPKDNLQLDGGHFDSETTNSREFGYNTDRRVSQYKAVKPIGNLIQEGEMNFTTSNQTDFQPKTAPKVEAIKPQQTSKITGEFDGTTTNQIMFQNKTTERVHDIRPKDNLQIDGGQFENETTTTREYGCKIDRQISQNKAIKPTGNLSQEGEMTFTTSNQTDFQPKTAPKVEPIKPQQMKRISGEFDGTTTNQVMYQNRTVERAHDIRPKDNLQLDGGHFDGETTNSREFGYNTDRRVSQYKPIKPVGNLTQEGEMNFETSNQTDFQPKVASKVEPIIPQQMTRISGEFDGTTTNQVMFQNKTVERVHDIRPKDNLQLDGGHFDSETTTSREFGYNSDRRVSQYKAIKPTGNLTQEGEMNFTTSNQTDFQPKTAPKVEPIKPQQMRRISGEFDGTTTNQVMYQNKTVERVHDIRPKDNLQLDAGCFDSETTTSREFGYNTDRRVSQYKAIKPTGNLTQEGEMNFTTSNQTDFQAKTAPKVEPIKPQQTSLMSGEFDGTTTNQVMFQNKTVERVHDIRPKDNLQLDVGHFDSETTTSREFGYNTDRRLSQYKPIKPVGNLTQEGEMSFETSNQTDFQPKVAPKVEPIKPQQMTRISGEFDGTTTNQVMFQNKSVERVHDIRPKDNLQLDGGQFDSETTTSREFGYNTERRVSQYKAIKPIGNLTQEGDMNFTTSNQQDFQPKTTPRVEAIKPKQSSQVTGEFDGTTTNQLMFQTKTIEKVHDIKPKDNLQLDGGQFTSETTTAREFGRKVDRQISQYKPIKPTGNLTQEGDMSFVTSNQTDFQPKKASKVEAIKPQQMSRVSGEFDGTTTNQVMFPIKTVERVHDVRPKDNLQVESGKFDSNTTNTREFNYKAADKPSPFKPKSTLTQEGDFDFKTSNQLQFEGKMSEKPAPIRPKTLTKTTNGEFHSTTTNQAMFETPNIEMVRGKKPSDNLQIEGGEFHGKTTSNEEYQQWKVQKPKSFQLVSSLAQEGDMSFETTNNSEFKERSFERVQPVRPKTTNKIEGEFETTTTNQMMFQQPEKIERVKPIRHQNNLHVEEGKFQNETTSKREFRQWVKMEKKSDKDKTNQTAGVKTSPNKSQQIKLENVKQAEKENLDSRKIKTDQKIEEKEKALTLEKSRMEKSKSNVKTNEIKSSRTIVVENQENVSRDVSAVITDYGSKTITNVKSNSNTNLNRSGDMNFSTTSQTDYTQQSPVSHKQQINKNINGRGKDLGFSQELSFSATAHKQQLNKSLQRKQDNINFGGEMSFSTTSQTDFNQKSPSHKQQLNRSSQRKQDNMSLSGEMSFSTTSQTDFNKKGTAAQKQQLNKSLQRKQDNMNLSGEMSFSTTSHNDFGPKTSTPHKQQLNRNSQGKQGNLSFGGEMSFSTTSQDFNNQLNLSQTETRHVSRQSRGRSSQRMSGSPNYDSWKAAENKLISRSGTSADHKGTLSKSESNLVHKCETQISPIKVSKRFRPDDNLKIEQVPFEGESMSRMEFKKWEARRSSSKKRGETLKQEGKMEFDVTSHDYAATNAYQMSREATKAKSKSDQKGSLGQSGAMEFSTTQNTSYTSNATTTRLKAVRPRSSFKLGMDDVSGGGGAVSSTRSNPETSRDSELTSTSRAAYIGHTASTRARPYRPTTSQKIGEGSFEAQTTANSSFTGHQTMRVEKVRAVKPESHNILDTGSHFVGDTTYRKSFESTKGFHCPVIDLETERSVLSVAEEKNGHIFYAPKVQG